MVFEGWVVDHLSTWLGHFLDIQRDQLQISLWRAWQTGVALDHIPFRLDAFEYLELPFRLTAGHIGRLQVQVPWRGPRSPLVLEVADARLEASLRGADELWEGPAGVRALAGKRARLAEAEASAGARGAVGDAAVATEQAPAQGSRGLLWGLASSLALFIVNRLQIRFTNITLVIRDPETGLGLELRLPSLHTCSPSDALRMLGASLEEALPQDSGDVRKHVALAGLSIWLLGPDSQRVQDAATSLLPPCDGVFVVATAAQAVPGAVLRADCSLTLPRLHLSMADVTLASVVELADRVDSVSRLNGSAAFCPRMWRLERRFEPRWVWVVLFYVLGGLECMMCHCTR